MTLIIYAIYAFLCATWVFFDSRKKGVPAGWAAVVFLAPVTLVWHLYKRHGERFFKLAGIWTATLFLLGFVECGALYIVKDNSRPKGAVAEGLAVRKKKVVKSLRELSDSLLQLEKRSRSISQRGTLDRGVVLIDRVFKNLRTNDYDIETLVFYIEAYRERLSSGELSDYIKLGDYFTGRKKLGFNESLKEYLVSFRRLLTYSNDNFDAISKGEQQAKKTYEALYFNYRLAVRRRNEITHKSLKLRADLLKRDPHLANLIPDKDRPETLSIWVKK